MKEKSIFKMVLSSYGNMALGGVLCFIVSVSCAMFGLNRHLQNVIILLFTAPLYSMLIYSSIWTEGDRNRNMVQFGHLEYDRYKGLKIGLFLTIPYLIANLLLTLSRMGVIFNIYPIYKIFNSHLWAITDWVNQPIGENLVTAQTVSVGGMVVLWLTSLYPLVISVAAYLLGYKGVAVMEKLIYKNKPKKKRRY